MKLPLEISGNAISEIKNIVTNKNIPSDYHLRIGAKGNGCSGISFYLGFDQQQIDDLIFEIEKISIVIKKKDFMHLIGRKLDFIDDITQRGFSFE